MLLSKKMDSLIPPYSNHWNHAVVMDYLLLPKNKRLIGCNKAAVLCIKLKGKPFIYVSSFFAPYQFLLFLISIPDLAPITQAMF
jgi:hypothetical protein